MNAADRAVANSLQFEVKKDGRSKISRFFEKISTPDSNGCWNWTGARSGCGYGYIKYQGKQWRAHRFSWHLHKGAIPDGMFVLHKCDNPACVNPAHLSVGTPRENSRDMVRKKRQAAGEKNGDAKLTDKKVRAILRDDRPHRAIAKDYGVAQTTISRVKRREGWRHVQ